MQSDQPAEPKEAPKKEKKGKKNKKKRDKGSKDKRKGKGRDKDKRRFRKKKHEEEALQEGFLKVSTILPPYRTQATFQATKLPEIKSTLETTIPTDVFYKTFTEIPTHEPDFTTESSTFIPRTLPVSKVTEEVDKFACRCCPFRSLPLFTALTNHSPNI